jgi:hypothetical protein
MIKYYIYNFNFITFFLVLCIYLNIFDTIYTHTYACYNMHITCICMRIYCIKYVDFNKI